MTKEAIEMSRFCVTTKNNGGAGENVFSKAKIQQDEELLKISKHKVFGWWMSMGRKVKIENMFSKVENSSTAELRMGGCRFNWGVQIPPHS